MRLRFSLLLGVLVWTCVCLVVAKKQQHQRHQRHHHHHHHHQSHNHHQQRCVAGTKRANGCYVCECKDKGVERCSFQLNEDIPKTPLILKGHGEPELLYPDTEYDIIHVPKNKKIKLSCLDKEFSKLHAKTVVAECLDDGRVLVRGRKMNMSELECEKFPSSALVQTNRTCHGNGTEYEVGFQLNKKFLKTMSVCFDETEKKAVYSWYESTKLHTGHQKNVNRPQFVSDSVYDFDVNKAYFRKEQIKSLTKTLKSKALAEKYIKNGHSMYYLARGHLTPKADFVYGSEQASSFHYANVAPQWQVFNEGNWQRVEENVRKLLLEHPDRYDVLTGTYGVATLPDVDNQQQELYLHVDSSGKKLPVPKLFWKTIYDNESRKGVTILGLNNPYVEDIPEDYVICKDICDSVDWFHVDTKKVNAGYIYCCDMNEFFRVTGYKNVFQPDEASEEIFPEEIDKEVADEEKTKEVEEDQKEEQKEEEEEEEKEKEREETEETDETEEEFRTSEMESAVSSDESLFIEESSESNDYYEELPARMPPFFLADPPILVTTAVPSLVEEPQTIHVYL